MALFELTDFSISGQQPELALGSGRAAGVGAAGRGGPGEGRGQAAKTLLQVSALRSLLTAPARRGAVWEFSDLFLVPPHPRPGVALLWVLPRLRAVPGTWQEQAGLSAEAVAGTRQGTAG